MHETYRRVRTRVLREVAARAHGDAAVSLCCGRGAELLALRRALGPGVPLVGVDKDPDALRDAGTTTDNLLAVIREFPIVPHVKVEYDMGFSGGDYSDVGAIAYVPMPLIDMCGIEGAFLMATGYDPIHIVFHSLDELFTANGDPYPEPNDLLDRA